MKKNRLFLIAMAFLLVVSLGGCGKEEPKVEPAGGWTEQDRDLSEREIESFQKAVEGTEYADYTPEGLIETQVVAGTNYRFRCKDGGGNDKVVTVYRDLQGNCSVTAVE